MPLSPKKIVGGRTNSSAGPLAQPHPALSDHRVCPFFAPADRPHFSVRGVSAHQRETLGREALSITVLGVIRRLRMTERYQASRRLKRVTGMTLVLSGVLFWMLVIALPLTPLPISLLASLG